MKRFLGIPEPGCWCYDQWVKDTFWGKVKYCWAYQKLRWPLYLFFED